MRVLLDGMAMLGRVTGIGWYVRNLASGLAAHPNVERVGVFDGCHVRAVEQALAANADERQVERHERLKAISARLPLRRHLVAAWRGLHFRRTVRAADWTLFHEPNYIAPAFSGPLVATVCDCCWQRYPKFQPAERLAWLNRRLPATLKRCAAVVTISEFSKREILESWPWLDSERVFVTPMGVDADYGAATCDLAALANARVRLGLPERFVLYVGTLEPRKNLQGLLEAYRLLPADLRREYPLVLVGAAGWNRWYFRNLLEELRADGSLQTLGYLQRADLPLVMGAATAFAFPSLYEGFGMPPLEAAACGTPTVCGDIPALREVMGHAAVYVEPTCPEDIAAGLQHVLNDAALRLRLGILGKQRAALFTWRRCTEGTLAAYRAALSDGPRILRTTLRKAS